MHTLANEPAAWTKINWVHIAEALCWWGVWFESFGGGVRAAPRQNLHPGVCRLIKLQKTAHRVAGVTSLLAENSAPRAPQTLSSQKVKFGRRGQRNFSLLSSTGISTSRILWRRKTRRGKRRPPARACWKMCVGPLLIADNKEVHVCGLQLQTVVH